MSISILATVSAKPEYASAVQDSLQKMIPASLAEHGCIEYMLFCSEEREDVFLLVESYIDDAALSAHHHSVHFAELVDSLAGKLVCDIQIEQMNRCQPDQYAE